MNKALFKAFGATAALELGGHAMPLKQARLLLANYVNA